MTIKELINKLDSYPDNAVVLLYNGSCKEEVPCYTTPYVIKKHLIEYCQTNSAFDNIRRDVALFILTGTEDDYVRLGRKFEKRANKILHRIIKKE